MTERDRAGGARMAALALAVCVLAGGSPLRAQEGGGMIELTFDRMVALGMEDSYRVRQLELEIQRTRSLLRAEEAELKTSVDLRIATPEFEAISDYKWNSELQQNEIVYTNTRLWEMDLSVRQPMWLFGYTNGYLSLNNRVYRYSQLADERDIRYYNRAFIAYEQPLFQPNSMENEREEARLDLESAELDYQDDIVEMIDDLADDYFELFEAAHDRVIASARVANLERTAEAARALAEADSTREIEVDQVQVELANAREQLQQNRSDFRLQAADIKQRLRLDPADSIVVDPELRVVPIDVDVDEAIRYATSLSPRLRQLAIRQRQDEIDLEETKGRNSFRMDLELSYGREMQDPHFQYLWNEPRNSYTVSVSGYIPIWDWGAREQRIRAEEYALQRTDLRIEETSSEIETNVRSQVRNLEEYQQRALNMQQNLELARQSTASTLEGYRSGDVALVDLFQTVSRQTETARNFLDGYLGYRRSLLQLQELTYYDFERDVRVLERFGIDTVTPSGS